MTKIIAFYLPQFHTIPENDEWWGKGFTEWTNIKKAIPLFKGHRQPKVPLDGNYYNLLDVATLKWQASLVNEYDIDGLCFYHYWFNGKQLLEKPINILLDNPDIELPFCISWANEPWTRAWDGSEREVIMAQEYGNIDDWEMHFQYLMRAFKDSRYIQYNDKPVLVIYRAASIPCFDEMIAYWRRRIVDEGFVGLHLIITNTSFNDKLSFSNYDAKIDFEPMHTITNGLGVFEKEWIKFKRRGKKILNLAFNTNFVESRMSYDFIWNKIISRPVVENTYPGAFIDWDNSPRKGYLNSLVVDGYSTEKFKKYFKNKYKQSADANSPFMFINAWNEWAEGTYLEPDESHGHEKLEILREIKKEFHNK
ncbi:glycosyltransferase WbsX family protein [Iodobacter ciconiae]|uniref:Glycosyl transferase n=1 Tax=Iodobacter ciconiae TaxID=2496266 RepID=A0A3S8ZWL3_9NEIS|nr:glycoside hydrolase family 99-like domain-containing protein [Iodobacter ciconiae]AZN37861.1 glycosyl transferase [Iodobacter ciconiae]